MASFEDRVEKRLDEMSEKLDNISDKLSGHGERLARVETKATFLGALAGVVGGFIAFVSGGWSSS